MNNVNEKRIELIKREIKEPIDNTDPLLSDTVSSDALNAKREIQTGLSNEYDNNDLVSDFVAGSVEEEASVIGGVEQSIIELASNEVKVTSHEELIEELEEKLLKLTQEKAELEGTIVTANERFSKEEEKATSEKNKILERCALLEERLDAKQNEELIHLEGILKEAIYSEWDGGLQFSAELCFSLFCQMFKSNSLREEFFLEMIPSVIKEMPVEGKSIEVFLSEAEKPMLKKLAKQLNLTFNNTPINIRTTETLTLGDTLLKVGESEWDLRAETQMTSVLQFLRGMVESKDA